MTYDIAIIGAGISGLWLAEELQKKGEMCLLLEAGSQAGGNIATSAHPAGYLLEQGPNSLLANEDILSQLDPLGLRDQLVPALPVSKSRFILQNGKPKVLPSSPPALLGNSFFSWATKLTIFKEPFGKHEESPAGESVADFFRRHFNEEIVQKAVSPFVSGIYAGDPEALLVAETFPQLVELEREHGSLIRGLMKSRGKTARRTTYTFKEGLQQLITKLAERNSPRLETPVQKVERREDCFVLHTSEGTFEARKVVYALPAYLTAQLLPETLPAKFSEALLQVNYPPLAALHFAFAREAVGHPLEGFGALHPKSEGNFLAGAIWSSSVFPGRCPEGEVLFTCFVGGAQNPQNTALSDQEILEKAEEALTKIYDISGKAKLAKITRWPKSIPQYDSDWLATKSLVPELEKHNLYVCANWYGGVSLPDRMKAAKVLAERLLNQK